MLVISHACLQNLIKNLIENWRHILFDEHGKVREISNSCFLQLKFLVVALKALEGESSEHFARLLGELFVAA